MSPSRNAFFHYNSKRGGRGGSSQNLSNSMDPYGVIQENIRCVARAHMVCCKSTYVVLQEHICCVARAHIALSEPGQASQSRLSRF